MKKLLFACALLLLAPACKWGNGCCPKPCDKPCAVKKCEKKCAPKCERNRCSTCPKKGRGKEVIMIEEDMEMEMR